MKPTSSVNLVGCKAEPAGRNGPNSRSNALVPSLPPAAKSPRASQEVPVHGGGAVKRGARSGWKLPAFGFLAIAAVAGMGTAGALPRWQRENELQAELSEAA